MRFGHTRTLAEASGAVAPTCRGREASNRSRKRVVSFAPLGHSLSGGLFCAPRSPATKDPAVRYEQSTIKSRWRIQRFSHSRRYGYALKFLALKPGHKVLDYGSGDGHLLRLAYRCQLRADYWAYEPVDEQFRQLRESTRQTDIRLTRSTRDFEDAAFDRIACCEVLEHLTEDCQRRLLGEIRRLLSPQGLAVISVPIEIGLSSFMKNLMRIVMGYQDSQRNVRTMLKSVFGIRIRSNQDDGYLWSHIGFYYRDLEKLIREVGMEVGQKAFSPFPKLRGFLNSQVFYVVRSLPTRA